MPRLHKEMPSYGPQGKRGAVKIIQSYLSLKRGIDSPKLNEKKISQKVLLHLQVKNMDT